MNSFGNIFRVSLFGESHGPAIGVTIDGCPAGLAIDDQAFLSDLARRRSGTKGTTQRAETDVPEIISGVFNGYTTGAPITLLTRNEDKYHLITSSSGAPPGQDMPISVQV
jgi:chorismate synthase